MSIGRGVFIVVEGTDGSGKGTQFSLLAERLAAEGYDVATFDFPQYEQPSSHFVREYLNGKYGAADQVNPYTASLFYALDRFEAGPKIAKALHEGKVVLANRYVGSNMAHQGTKFQHAEERRGYFIWLDNLEYEMLHVPRPTASIVLRVPAETAQKLVAQKAPRAYTDKKLDIHESDISHMRRAVEVYDDMCQLFPRDFMRVDCTRDGELIDIQTINDILWQKITPLLPRKKNKKPKAAPATPPPVFQEPVTPEPASAELQMPEPGVQTQAKATLDSLVSSTSGKVYAFTPDLSPAKAARIVAQLSQRNDDVRTKILAEIEAETPEAQRSAVQGSYPTAQLSGMHLVVEDASSLLVKKIERGRMASYVEQPARLIGYDLKDADDQYRYHTPQYLEPRLLEQYQAHMDQICNLYGEIVRGITSYLAANATRPQDSNPDIWHQTLEAHAREIARPVLPVAATTKLGIYGTGQAVQSIVMKLLGDSLPEAHETGKALLTEARKAWPHFMDGVNLADDVSYQATKKKKLNQIAHTHLPDVYANTSDMVALTGIYPRNELDLLPDMLYGHSSLPLADLRKEIESWPYERKLEAFEAYIGDRKHRDQRPGRALENAHYSWDIVSEYEAFRDLQRHRMVDGLEWQKLTPRYGFEVPRVIDEADLLDQFEACFDLSLRLYSILQEAGLHEEAQYATLMGHRMRWKVTINAREVFHMHELRTSPHNRPEVRKLVTAMHAKLAERHPLIAEAIKFVG